jgi:hypothetical protein
MSLKLNVFSSKNDPGSALVLHARELAKRLELDARRRSFALRHTDARRARRCDEIARQARRLVVGFEDIVDGFGGLAARLNLTAKLVYLQREVESFTPVESAPVAKASDL